MMKLLTPESTLASTFATRSAIYLARHGCTAEEILETLINECDVDAYQAQRIIDHVAPSRRSVESDHRLEVAA